MGAPLFRCLLLTVLAALPVQAAPIRISGRVVLPAGTKSAQVELRRVDVPYEERVRAALEPAPAPAASAQLGADGRFSLTAPGPGFYRVVAKAEGFLPLQMELVPLEQNTELPTATPDRASAVAVKVAPKARLLVLGSTPPSGESPWYPAPREAVAGEGGIGQIPYKPGETLAVILARPQAVAFFVEVRPETVRELRPFRSVSLEARGADDRPVPGALVSLAGFPLTLTGADGRFTLDLPGPGGMVTVEGPGGQWVEVSLDPASVTPGEIRIARLQPPRAMTGRVLDADTGQPLPNAKVRGATASAVTDAEGRFRIELPPRSYGLFLRASANGYVDANWFPEGGNTGPATFSLRRAGGLAGQVVDAGSRPVARARVRALPAPTGSPLTGPPSGEARTDADGRFRIPELRAGWTYALRVDGGDFAPARQLAEVPPADRPGEPLRITVTPGATASGRVVDPDGQPVPGATVRLQSARQEEESWWSDPEGSKPIESLSGPEGRFLLPRLAAGRYALQVTREGLAPGRIAGLEIPSDTPAVDLGDIRLEASAAIEGRVLDERGRPVEGARIGLSYSDRQAAGPRPPAKSGPDGSFRLKDLARGDRYDLWVQADGFVPRQAPGVEAPPAEPLRIELRRGRTLAVRVVDPDGQPVPRARLSRVESIMANGYGHHGSSSLGETDDEGTLRIGNLEPGVLDLLVRAEGFQPMLARGLHIPDDADAGAVEVSLARGGVLEGRVLDGDGKAVTGASVSASLEDAESPLSGAPPATTDGEGRYRLEGLAPGSYEVTVHSVELSDTLWAKAEVGAGVRRLDFRFPSGAQVSGQVVDSRGAPVSRAALSLVPVGGGYISNTVSRADGTFTFRAVPDGDFYLRGAAPGFARTTDPGEVRVSGRPVQGLLLRLDRGAAIAGRLLGIDPDSLAEARILADFREPGHYQVLHGVVDRQGAYRIANATPGTWHVTAQLPDGRSAQGQVEVTAADTDPVTLDLEFEDGLTLSGRVLLDGEPLAGGSLAVDGRSSTIAYDGSFSVSGLKPGPHRLDVVVGPGLGQALQVEMARDEEMTIQLSTGSISGRVLSPEGLPLGGAFVDVAAEQPDLNASFEGLQVLTTEDGAFQVPRCIAGSYRLRVHADGLPLAESHVLVPPGGTVHAEIALETKE